MSAPRPIVVRGRSYRSQAAAARALGITPAAITLAVQAGRVERVGLSPSESKGRPVTIRGRRYRSRGEAARALGVSRAAICQAAREGRLDGVALGHGAAAARRMRFHVVARGAGVVAVNDRASGVDVWRGRELREAVREARRRASAAAREREAA